MEGDWHSQREREVEREGIIYARRQREGEEEEGMDVVYRGLAIAFIPSLHYSCALSLSRSLARGVIAEAEGISIVTAVSHAK